MACLASELEELLDEELEEELLEGEVSETSSFSLFPDPLKPSFRFDFLSASDDEPRSSTLAGMRGEPPGIALIVLPWAPEGTWARTGTEVRHITGRVVSFAGISIGPLMVEAPDITPIGPMAADDDEDDEDDDDDDDDDDELEIGGETLSKVLCSSSDITWKVG